MGLVDLKKAYGSPGVSCRECCRSVGCYYRPFGSCIFGLRSVQQENADLGLHDLQRTLGQIEAKFEVVGMRVNTLKSETVVLYWKTVDCYL